jgi:hypothetical protein
MWIFCRIFFGYFCRQGAFETVSLFFAEHTENKVLYGIEGRWVLGRQARYLVEVRSKLAYQLLLVVLCNG